jgi:opacity protein-like surface antigen
VYVLDTFKRVLFTGCVAIVVACLPSRAQAQTFFSPYIGANGGGDVECPSTGPCADGGVTIGGAYGYFNELIGLEEDLGFAMNPFRDDPPADSRVLTLMTNLMIGPQIGFVRPYGLIGAGFMRATVDPSPTRLNAPEHTDFGWDLGAGVLAAYGHIGVRADLRFFRSFADFQAKGFPVSGELNFGRASIGLVIQ